MERLQTDDTSTRSSSASNRRKASAGRLSRRRAFDRTYALLVFGLALSGLTSFAYEIYWTRSLVFVLGNSTYALTTMLTAFIAGIALGGYLARLVVDRLADRVALFGWIQVLIAVSSAVALPVLFAFLEPQAIRQFLGEAASEVGLLAVSRFGIDLLVMLVPATLVGGFCSIFIVILTLGRYSKR